jgi:hypothetical protein
MFDTYLKAKTEKRLYIKVYVNNIPEQKKSSAETVGYYLEI